MKNKNLPIPEMSLDGICKSFFLTLFEANYYLCELLKTGESTQAVGYNFNNSAPYQNFQ